MKYIQVDVYQIQKRGTLNWGHIVDFVGAESISSLIFWFFKHSPSKLLPLLNLNEDVQKSPGKYLSKNTENLKRWQILFHSPCMADCVWQIAFHNLCMADYVWAGVCSFCRPVLLPCRNASKWSNQKTKGRPWQTKTCMTWVVSANLAQ